MTWNKEMIVPVGRICSHQEADTHLDENYFFARHIKRMWNSTEDVWSCLHLNGSCRFEVKEIVMGQIVPL